MSAPVDGDARELAWNLLAPGFTALDDVVESLREWAADDPEAGVDADGGEAVVRELWARRLEQLATAPARRPTDDERVAAAFEALERDGLTARMCLGWDQGEGGAEAERLARSDGRAGYGFFHGQDAEGLAHPAATLHLRFDAVPPPGHERFDSRDEYDAAAVAVGHRIARALTAQGLDVRWNGSATVRIEVVGLDWRRPLPA